MGLFNALISLMTAATISFPMTPPATLFSRTQPLPANTATGVWPLQPHTVVGGFEPPSDQFSAGHRGVDLAGTLGAPVVASLAGTVSFAGVIARRGVVVVNHGDTRTTYEPVIADVHRGDAVASGDRLGTLDIVQSHCFPSVCLHWGWLRGSDYLDPLLLVQSTTHVRLLPLNPDP